MNGKPSMYLALAVIAIFGFGFLQTAEGQTIEVTGPQSIIKNESAAFNLLYTEGTTASMPSQDYDLVSEFYFIDELGNTIDYHASENIIFNNQNIGVSFPSQFIPSRVGNFTLVANLYKDGALVQSTNTAASGTVQKEFAATIPHDALESSVASLPQTSAKGNLFNSAFQVKNNSSFNVYGFIEIKLENSTGEIIDVFSSPATELNPLEEKTIQIEKKINAPAGNYAVSCTLFFEGQSSQACETQLQVTTSQVLDSVQAPSIIEAGQSAEIRVVLKNQSESAITPAVYGDLTAGENEFQAFFENSTEVSPSKELEIIFSTKTLPAGEYTINVRAIDGDNTEVAQKTILASDTLPPTVKEAVFSKRVNVGAPNGLQVLLEDASKITRAEIKAGKTAIPLTEISKGVFTGAHIADGKGNRQSFELLLCDEFENCQTYSDYYMVSREASSCNGKKILLVDDTKGTGTVPYWTPLCSEKWDTQKYGPVPVQFLEGFNIVFWFAENTFAQAIDENEANLLSTFVGNGGRLFISGSNVSSEHAFDSFAENTLHAYFGMELSPEENPAMIAFRQDTPQQFRLGEMGFDSNQPFPINTIVPSEGAFPIAGYDENSYAIVGWLDRCNRAKTVFASFSLSSLPEKNAYGFLVYSLSWFLENPKETICPAGINPGREITRIYPSPLGGRT